MKDEKDSLEQQRFQLVIKELNAAVFEWNLKDGSFYSSEAYQKYALSRVDNKDILSNCSLTGVIHSDDTEQLQTFFKEASENKERAESVFRLKMMDGTFQWCHLVFLFYKDIKGNLERIIGIIIDVNEEQEKNFMLNSILNELPGGVGIFKFAEQLVCHYFSDGFAQISGRTREEVEALIQNRNLLETVIAPSDYKRFMEKLKNEISQGLPLNLTYRYLTKDGKIGWLHLSATKLREEDGFPVYYCVFTNPSEEMALYRDVVEDSANGVFVAERDSRKVLYISDAVSKIFNIPREIIQQRMNNSENISQKYVFLSQEDIHALKRDEFTEFHVVWGDKLYLSIKAKAISWNGIDAYIMYFTDETAEHEQQMQLQELVNRVPGGVGIFENHDGIAQQVYMNDGFYRMVSDTRENRNIRTGGNFIESIHPEDRKIIREVMNDFFQGVNERECVLRTQTGQGGYIWIRMAAAVVKRNDRRMTIYCSLSDHSEAVAAREALENTNNTIRQQYERELERRRLLEKGSIISVCSNITKKEIIELKSNGEMQSNYFSGMTFEKAIEVLIKSIPNQVAKQRLWNVLSSEQIIERLEKGISEGTLEYRSLQPDGSLHWIRCVCSAHRMKLRAILLPMLIIMILMMRRRHIWRLKALLMKRLNMSCFCM